MTLNRLLSMFWTTVGYWIEPPKMPIVPWKCMVLLTLLLQFEQLAFCFSRGDGTRNEYLLITLCMMTVRNSCSEPGLKHLLCQCMNCTFQLLIYWQQTGQLTSPAPRKLLAFFFFLISRNQELWKKSAEMFSARIEKYQLTFSAFPYPTDHPVNQTEKVLGFLYLVYCYLHNLIYDSWGMANELRLPLVLKCWHLSVTRIDGEKATRAVNMQFMV